jgi:hypothetical protein
MELPCWQQGQETGLKQEPVLLLKSRVEEAVVVVVAVVVAAAAKWTFHMTQKQSFQYSHY